MYYTIIQTYHLTDTDVKTLKKWFIDHDIVKSEVSERLLFKNPTYVQKCLLHKYLPHDLVNYLKGKNFNFRLLHNKEQVAYFKLDEAEAHIVMRQREILGLTYKEITQQIRYSNQVLREIFTGKRAFTIEKKQNLEKVGFNFDFEIVYKDNDDPVWGYEF